MHYFAKNSQCFVINSINCVLILQNWKLPKYQIGQFVEYQDKTEEKDYHRALIRGCKYYLGTKSWEYDVIDLDDEYLNDRIDEYQVTDSQIVRLLSVVEIIETCDILEEV